MKSGKNNKKYLIIIFLIYLNINEIDKSHFFFFFIYMRKKYAIQNLSISFKGKNKRKSKLTNARLSNISNNFLAEKLAVKERLNKLFNLSTYSNDFHIKLALKKEILDFLSIKKRMNISKIDIIFLSKIQKFGNNLITINNCIFYCQIIGCNKIILKESPNRREWLIKNPVFIEKLNITILQGSSVNCQNDIILCPYEIEWNFFYPKFVIPQIRTNLIKSEILRNLPNVNIQKDSLYIHIRGGDVFKFKPNRLYAQPPLCFYEKIINNNKFKTIHIISMDEMNPIVKILINKYKNIFFNKNHFEYDIALLANAYNIVVSVSSFSLSSIKLNNNLKNLWEFDMLKLVQKLIFLHHHLFKFEIKYQIHTMKPSDIYISKMFSWKNSKEQIQLMLKDNCPHDFVTVKPTK